MDIEFKLHIDLTKVLDLLVKVVSLFLLINQ